MSIRRTPLKGVSVIRIAEKWAMYPMHLLMMFMTNLFFGTMNLFWSVYDNYSILSTAVSLLYITTWIIYAISMRRRSMDFIILTTVFWLGGLCLIALFNGFESTMIVLVLLFFSSAYGFVHMFSSIPLSEDTVYYVTSFICYLVVIGTSIFCAIKSKQKA
ncbi:hypothetical protein M3231_26290 [Neobacillus mesonae]|nr:hypothetical protein [Neobacillus mesonae]